MFLKKYKIQETDREVRLFTINSEMEYLKKWSKILLFTLSLTLICFLFGFHNFLILFITISVFFFLLSAVVLTNILFFQGLYEFKKSFRNIEELFEYIYDKKLLEKTTTYYFNDND